MFDKIRRLWTQKPGTSESIAISGGVPASPQSQADQPLKIKVTCKGSGKTLTVTDAETGRVIPVTEFSLSVGVSGQSMLPRATFKTYLQDFEYEGPGYRFVFCPKCKREVEQDAKSKPC